MINFKNVGNCCIFCKKKLPVKSICHELYDGLFEIEWVNAHKICRRYEMEKAFIRNEIELLNKSV